MKLHVLLLAGVSALAPSPTPAQAPNPAPAAPGKPLPSTYLPTRFKLFIGGNIFPPNYNVELQGDSLVYRVQTLDSATNAYKEAKHVVKPSPDQWRQFWKAMDEINAWGWKPDYVRTDVADGTFWSVEIGYGRRMIRSRGQNNYPGAVQVSGIYEQGPAFKKYLSAVEALVGGAPFR